MRYTWCNGYKVDSVYQGPSESLSFNCRNMEGRCNGVLVSSRPATYNDLRNRVTFEGRVIQDTMYGRCNAVYRCGNTGELIVYDSTGTYGYDPHEVGTDSLIYDVNTYRCYRNFRYCDFPNPLGPVSLVPFSVSGTTGRPVFSMTWGVQVATRNEQCSYGSDYYEYNCFGRRLKVCISNQSHQITWQGWIPRLISSGSLIDGINEALEMEIYPNPTIHDLSFKVTNASLEDSYFEIYDLLGRLVEKTAMQHIYLGKEYKIELVNSLSAGQYYFKLITKDKGNPIFKIIKH
jgi:Secretion system C-terminal sorting domain